jgi:SAM-dependent methyltransferase
VTVLGTSQDAFGRALLDYSVGTPGPTLMLERDDGSSGPSLQPAEFFAPPDAWPEWEQQAVAAVSGPVLDLGAGAGRHSLFLQEAGHEVTAVDHSPGAVDVCRARGVLNVRLADLTDPPEDRRWGAVLLMCGNLGLAGDRQATRSLLARLARGCRSDAIVVTDTVDPTVDNDANDLAYFNRNLRMGRDLGLVRLRLRYGDLVTPWWDLLLVPRSDIDRLVNGTGWAVRERIDDGADYLLTLVRA